MKKIVYKILSIVLLVALLMPLYPALAVELPDTQQIIGAEVYRSVRESLDQLYLFNYNLEYTTDPDEPASDTYLFRLVNTGTGALEGSTTPYAMVANNYGYDAGIASIYFSAADALTWNGAYALYFDGNPALHWYDSTATTAMIGVVADDGGVQTDETTESNSAAANDMTLLPLIPALNDAYYFGSDRKFTILTINIGQQGNGTWTITWEYWDGDSWEAFSGVTDGTTGFTAATGNRDVTWNDPSDWNANNVDGITAYWARARVSSYTAVVAQPLGTQSWTNTVDPPSINLGTFTWIDEGSVSAAQDRLTTRLRYIASTLEIDWGGTTDLIEDTATGKVLTLTGEEYFENTILNLRQMCPDLFYQEMQAVEFERDILVTELLSSGADGTVSVYGVNWFAQTIVPSERYAITGANLPLYRTGLPGQITMSLRATAAGLPTGADLVSGTYDGDSLTTNTEGEWVGIAFTDDYTLTAGTTYAIVVRATAGALANRVNWFVDTGNGYANGQECTSINSGVAWNAVAANDMLFEILARGGVTQRGGRLEGRLLGTLFDLSQIARNWQTSTVWINTVLWGAMMIVLCWAVSLASNSWDLTVIVVAICTAHGWRTGYVDSTFMTLVFAGLAIGAVYAAFWKKAY